MDEASIGIGNGRSKQLLGKKRRKPWGKKVDSDEDFLINPKRQVKKRKNARKPRRRCPRKKFASIII